MITQNCIRLAVVFAAVCSLLAGNAVDAAIIGINEFASNTSTGNSTTQTLAFDTTGDTGAGSNTALVVVVGAHGDSSSLGIDSVTFGGQTLTQNVTVNAGASSQNALSSIYWIMNPTAQSDTITATFNQSVNLRTVAAAWLSDVDTSFAPITASGADTRSNNSDFSIDLTTTTSDMLYIDSFMQTDNFQYRTQSFSGGVSGKQELYDTGNINEGSSDQGRYHVVKGEVPSATTLTDLWSATDRNERHRLAIAGAAFAPFVAQPPELVPEPSSFALFAILGMAALALLVGRRRR